MSYTIRVPIVRAVTSNSRLGMYSSMCILQFHGLRPFYPLLNRSPFFRYEAGDHLGVYPKNQTAVVEQLAKRLGCLEQLESGICLYSNNSKAVLGPCTLRSAFTELLDITTPPRKALLRALVQYAEDQTEKEFLATISSSKEESLLPEVFII